MSPKFDIITLEQIVSRLHDERFPDMKADKFFEIFVAEQILKERDLTDEQLLAGNVGGPNEGGIDAIHLFVNGDHIDDTNVGKYKSMRESVQIDLHLIQAKDKNRMESSVIKNFSDMADVLLKPNVDLQSLGGAYNSGVLQVFEWFWDIYNDLWVSADVTVSIAFSYATKAGGSTKKMRDAARRLEKKVGQNINKCNSRFEFIGATELLDLSHAKPQAFFLLPAAEHQTADDEGRSYLALVSLDNYYQFVTSDGGELQWRLFDANVRDWQGNNKVNRQIQDSLRHRDANDFWWLNNGVTMLVKSVAPKGKTLRLENPEIVNGLQTTRAVWQHFRGLDERTKDDRRILIRIIVVDDNSKNRETIIRATNSQTAVPTYALRSLDRIHLIIEEYFLAQKEYPLFYDRRKNYYKNQGKPAKSIIDLRTLAQAIIAIGLGKPDDARGRPSDYLSADDEKYRTVFDDDTHPQFYFFCARLYKRVEETLKNEKIEAEYDTAQRRSVRFHILTHVISRHLEVAPSQLSKAINNIAKLNITHICDSLIIESANRVLRLLGGFRRQQQSSRIKWSEFEEVFFKDLKSLLQQSSSQ